MPERVAAPVAAALKNIGGTGPPPVRVRWRQMNLNSSPILKPHGCQASLGTVDEHHHLGYGSDSCDCPPETVEWHLFF
jgi:hypothetical protein